jgi:putative ABC transport system permease protein
MDTFFQDLRYGARTLIKTPLFTLIAIACLALGIGVNTAIFSVTDAILMTPFGFEKPDELVVLFEAHPKRDIDDAGPSFRNFRDWQRQAQSFSGIAAQSFRSLTLTELEEPVRLQGATITWNMFPMLGVRPILGRVFREDEDQPGAPGTVLLGHDTWVQRFSADSGIIGRTIQVNAKPHTVVGVMPPRFKFPENAELWIPITPIEHESPRGARGVSVFGRLKPGVSADQATTELKAIAARLEEAYPVENKGWSARAASLRDEFIPGEIRLIVLTMMGAVTFVLLIACANVANLMLARATGRQREIAIRAALGAGRGRMIRMLLTESVLLGLAGGVIGIGLANLGLGLLDASLPSADFIPYYIDWNIDRDAMMYTVVISIVTGLVFGLAPALQISANDLQSSLKEGTRGAGSGARRNRLRNVLVVGEVALSVVLLIGASLFVRSFLNLQKADAGFATERLMTLRIYMPGDRYAGSTPKAQRVADVVRRIEALPGVIAATASNNIALSGGGSGGSVIVEGHPVPAGEEEDIFYAAVTPHWFKTLDVPIIRGRDFTDAEGQDSSEVAIINQTMADKLWPKEDPLGRRFRMTGDTAAPWFTVIGITRDIKTDDIDREDKPRPAAFIAYPYEATPNTGITIRTATADPAQIMSAVRGEVRASDPILPVFEVQTMQTRREEGYWEYNLFSGMFSVFGGVALLLAAIGVYGVISYGVSQRTHEIGVRMALGARGGDVLRMVVGQGVMLTVIGVGLGLVGAFGVTRVIESMLFAVSPTDPLSFIGIALFLTTVAAVASYIPARRAMGVDPVTALRYE